MNSGSLLCRFRSLLILQKSSKIRQMYSAASIGLEDYIVARKRYEEKCDLNSSRFKKKMQEICGDKASDTALVFTEDLKQMVHIAGDNPEDVKLVENMILKFHSQVNHLRFGSYVFGPVVMRLFHYLNKPEEALKAFKNENLNGFFDQLSSHIVLMDLLFNNEMYHEIIEVYKIMRDKQLAFGTHPKSAMVLIFGAYYKLNTPEHYEEAVKLFEEMNERGHKPLRRAISLMAALALNQNNPHLSLEIISTLPKQQHVLPRCIKALAFCELDRTEDAIVVIKNILQFDKPYAVNHTFPIEVIEKVGKFVEKQGNKQLIADYSRIYKQLKEQNHLIEKTLDDLLTSEVTVVAPVKNIQTVLNAAMDKSHVNHKKAFRLHQRPGLNEMI